MNENYKIIIDAGCKFSVSEWEIEDSPTPPCWRDVFMLIVTDIPAFDGSQVYRLPTPFQSREIDVLKDDHQLLKAMKKGSELDQIFADLIQKFPALTSVKESLELAASLPQQPIQPTTATQRGRL
ncbi:hypothetical protein ACXZ1M_24360 [Duganella sp. PWIR1]